MEEDISIRNPKFVSETLYKKTSEMQKVQPYRTIKHGEPPICSQPITFSKSTDTQHKRNIIHTLVRSDAYGNPRKSHLTMAFMQA